MPPTTVPIIDQLVHPALGLLSRSAPLAASSGSGTLTPPQNPLIALTYGLNWSFFTVPVGFGYAVGDPDVYYNRMIQLACEYSLLGGVSILTQPEDVYTDGGTYFWNEPLPTSVHFTIAPGVTVIFYWLQT